MGMGAISGPMRRTDVSRIAYVMVRGDAGRTIPVDGSMAKSDELERRKLKTASVPVGAASELTRTGRNP